MPVLSTVQKENTANRQGCRAEYWVVSGEFNKKAKHGSCGHLLRPLVDPRSSTFCST